MRRIVTIAAALAVAGAVAASPEAFAQGRGQGGPGPGWRAQGIMGTGQAFWDRVAPVILPRSPVKVQGAAWPAAVRAWAHAAPAMRPQCHVRVWPRDKVAAEDLEAEWLHRAVGRNSKLPQRRSWRWMSLP